MNRHLLCLLAAVAMSVQVWADHEVSVVYQLNGAESTADAAGTVAYEVLATNGQCTLVVTPAEGNYITAAHITAERIVNGNLAGAPRRSATPSMGENMIEVTATDADADPSAKTTYTFQMPGDMTYDVLVTANFQTRQSIAEGTLALTLPDGGYTYDGQAKEPAVQVTVGETVLAATDYTIVYDSNTDAGEATVSVTGQRTYTGTLTTKFAIEAKTLTADMFSINSDMEEFIYNGEEQTPWVEGLDGNNYLSEETDYDIAYSNNTNVGTAVITITGKNNYKGTVRLTFQIKRQLDVVFREAGDWATYYAPESIEVPAGLKAYSVTSVTGTTVAVQQLGYIPVGAGVLLQAEELADMYVAAAYEHNSYGDDDVMPVGNNLLRGCPEATAVESLTADANVYVLYQGDFVRTISGTIPAGRAYLPLSKEQAASARLTIGLADDETTGIATMHHSQGAVYGEVYNLNGQRVSRPARGLYIVDGRKVVMP